MKTSNLICNTNQMTSSFHVINKNTKGMKLSKKLSTRLISW